MVKKAIFIMEKREGASALSFCGGQQAPYDAWVSLCKPKQVVRMTLQEHKHPKTNEQLGWYHAGILPDVRDAFFDAGYNTMGEVEVKMKVGVRLDTDTCDKILKELYQSHLKAKNMPLKRNFSVEDMSQFIEFIIQWTAENLNAAIRPPTITGA